jgi:hypothetical protein
MTPGNMRDPAPLLHRPALTQGSQLVRFATVGGSGPRPARLVLRRLIFQGRYSPFQRFQFMNCA